MVGISTYCPYAIVFDEPAPCRLVKGIRKHDTHLALVKRHGLDVKLREDPERFVMGRMRFYVSQKAVLCDSVSDLYLAQTGIEKPVDNLSGTRLWNFELILWTVVPRGWRLYLLNAGLALRVPGVSPKRLTKMLGSNAPDDAGRIRELTPPNTVPNQP